MQKAIARLQRRSSSFFTEKSVSQRTLAIACAVLVALMLLPLVIIALYNYPADDDFAFTLKAADAWLHTGSLWEALKAIWLKTVEIYETWQGNFVSTFFFGLTPMVFDIRLYFLSSWFLLALLCLSVGYLVKGVTGVLLHAGRAAFWIVYTAVLVLVLQFMPGIGYSVYWHNGGMYTVAACTLMQALGLSIRLCAPQTRKRALLRGALLTLCGFMLGGSFYGPALGAFVLLLLLTVAAHVKKAPNRWALLCALCFFLLSFAISAAAPGVALRQERTGDTVSPLRTVLTAMLDSFDLAGGWLSPQLLGMLLLLLPTLWKPLKESRFSFRFPFWFFVMFYGLFASALAPGIYTGFGYATERYLNVLYFYFLIAVIASALYAQGALIRLLERRRERKTEGHLLLACENLGQRFGALYLALCIALTCFGGFEYTIMNTASVSALQSLVTGEAARFRQEMSVRQEYIRVTDSDVVAVQPLASQPYVFKSDKLPFQGIYGRVRYMKWYFELFEEAQ
ncbi:MAG: hypothetical protein RR367_05860 [Clostridia bacterium]